MICKVDDCSKQVFSREWCVAHYKRWYKYGNAEYYPQQNGDFSKNISRALKKAWTEGKYNNRNTVVPNWTGKKHTEKAKEKLRKYTGPKSSGWKGDDIGYQTVHLWIKKELGMPTICENCDNSELNYRQYHWANLSGEYKRDISDWARLCQVCHFRYDNVGEKIWVTRRERGTDLWAA